MAKARGPHRRLCLAARRNLRHHIGMTKFALRFASATLLCLAGCDGDVLPRTKAGSTTTQDIAIEKDVLGIEAGVRLAAANKRIDELEAQVEALKVNPQTVDITLLKQRLEAVELAVYEPRADRTNANVADPKKVTPSKPTADDVKPVPVRKAAPEPKVSRPATKAEADAFAKGG